MTQLAAPDAPLPTSGRRWGRAGLNHLLIAFLPNSDHALSHPSPLKGAGHTTPLATFDARWFQIAFLASFLLLGALARDFALTWQQVLLTFCAAIGTQMLWQWGLKLPTRRGWSGYLSAIVSSFGISILVRADSLWVHPLLAALAMSSKFVLRAGPASCRSHVLNPANFAAFAAWAWLPGAWLSPGQWGSASLAALWFIALGGIVSSRVQRLDISLTLLISWGGLLAARLIWLDYSFAVGSAMWLQQISNGATLLFAFFMISDPMTTPQRRAARIVYAVGVAIAAFVWQWGLYKPHGLIVALFAASAFVPFINHRWPTARFAWR